jgi:hypothetical protein
LKYLLEVTENYRVDNENEAAALIAENKHSKQWVLKKYNSVLKELKSKGEIVDSWYKVSLTKKITDEKEPDVSIELNYIERNKNNGYNSIETE